jgi:hypothetical protein
MTYNVGTYYFGRHHRDFRIYVVTDKTEKTMAASPVKDVFTYEDAVKEVYRLNGWGEPKKINKRY